MMMQLQLINRSSNYSPGFGAGSGEVIRENYKCPCGEGTVVVEKDDIPGFKSTDVWCECEECREKYDFGKGTATEKK